MNTKDDYIFNRVKELQSNRKNKLEEAEYYGYPCYVGDDDCSWEEAEEEWNRINPDNEEE